MEGTEIVTESVDTVTPIEVPGEGFNQGSDVLPQVVPQPDADEEKADAGEVTVATPQGYTFTSADPEVVVDSTGLSVTPDQAQVLVDNSDGLVFVVEED